jgi:septum formation inhibitor MinC
LKNRQYSLKVLEITIEAEDEVIAFLEKHSLLFMSHLLLMKGEMSDTLEDYLKQKSFHYLHNVSLPEGRNKKSLEEEIKVKDEDKVKALTQEFDEKIQSLSVEKAMIEQELKEELLSLKKRFNTKFTVLDTMIRSGRELKIDGDLLLLNRVNSGATIHTSGNLIITQVVEGALRCDGQFMMITVSPKANIIFNGVVVDNELLENKLNRIELKNNEIYITPVIKKDINWEQS